MAALSVVALERHPNVQNAAEKPAPNAQTAAEEVAANVQTAEEEPVARPDGGRRWWLAPNSKHAHTACPLRPFAHMVVQVASRGTASAAAAPALSASELAEARIVHVSEGLRRKVQEGKIVGDLLVLDTAADRRLGSVSAGLWSMFSWLVGPSVQAAQHTDTTAEQWPQRQSCVAHTADDDPQLVGNEGLGTVNIAHLRHSKGCTLALCAHTMAAEVEAEWWAWRRRPGLSGTQLAVVHVAEITTLHQAACGGLEALVPPPVPLELHFSPMRNAERPLGPPPALPRLVRPEAGLPAKTRWASLLVSRHGLVEMAYPLGYTRLWAREAANDPALEDGLRVALASMLGESLFARVHPEDVFRVVKALRLAWDARPDVYHFARLRREWQERRLAPASSCACAVPPFADRQIFQREGIEVTNGLVELNVQIQIIGESADLDWACPDAVSNCARFARMTLTRWPLLLKPRPDSDDAFVLVALQPLPEPVRSRTHAPADRKSRSISSLASASTLVVLSHDSDSPDIDSLPSPPLQSHPIPYRPSRRSSIFVGSLHSIPKSPDSFVSPSHHLAADSSI